MCGLFYLLLYTWMAFMAHLLIYHSAFFYVSSVVYVDCVLAGYLLFVISFRTCPQYERENKVKLIWVFFLDTQEVR